MQDRHETYQRESQCEGHQAQACRDLLNLVKGFHLYRDSSRFGIRAVYRLIDRLLLNTKNFCEPGFTFCENKRRSLEGLMPSY